MKQDESGELLPDSERLTKFGKALRSTNLELPELINIISGKPGGALSGFFKLYVIFLHSY